MTDYSADQLITDDAIAYIMRVCASDCDWATLGSLRRTNHAASLVNVFAQCVPIVAIQDNSAACGMMLMDCLIGFIYRDNLNTQFYTSIFGVSRQFSIRKFDQADFLSEVAVGNSPEYHTEQEFWAFWRSNLGDEFCDRIRDCVELLPAEYPGHVPRIYVQQLCYKS